MRLFVTTTALICVASSSFAQSDAQIGTYRPALPIYGLWDCQSVGSDGGAIAVRPGRLELVEGGCDLRDPVPVRDMDGILFDASCEAEGETYSQRMMLLSTEDELHILSPRGASSWKRCDPQN